jgi:hypothetical protein
MTRINGTCVQEVRLSSSRIKIPVSFCNDAMVKQVHVQVTPWLSHIFRLYDGARHVEFEWEAGPLPEDDGGMQVIIC